MKKFLCISLCLMHLVVVPMQQSQLKPEQVEAYQQLNQSHQHTMVQQPEHLVPVHDEMHSVLLNDPVIEAPQIVVAQSSHTVQMPYVTRFRAEKIMAGAACVGCCILTVFTGLITVGYVMSVIQK